MEPDYYAILGIPPDANIETLKQAYRRRALECHPDRGGSHEQMVLVNEAWLILSNPTTRRHYDSARADRSNYVVQRTARKDAQDTRQKAQEYPREWDDFEKWFNRNYGITTVALGMKFPTGGRSVVRWLFIIAGFIFGCFMLYIAAFIFVHLGISSDGLGKVIRILFPILFLVGGAWLGVLLHYYISNK